MLIIIILEKTTVGVQTNIGGELKQTFTKQRPRLLNNIMTGELDTVHR